MAKYGVLIGLVKEPGSLTSESRSEIAKVGIDGQAGEAGEAVSWVASPRYRIHCEDGTSSKDSQACKRSFRMVLGDGMALSHDDCSARSQAYLYASGRREPQNSQWREFRMSSSLARHVVLFMRCVVTLADSTIKVMWLWEVNGGRLHRAVFPANTLGGPALTSFQRSSLFG
jgi:hypothetical protein